MGIEVREFMTIKVEVTYNLDPVPTPGADAMLVEDLDWSFADVIMHQRNPVKPSLGSLGDLFAGALIEITGRVELKGSGTAGTPPEIDALLRGCSHKVVNVPATSDTYSLISTGQESVTVYLEEDGLEYKVTGCRGMITGEAARGKPGFLPFTLKGHFSGPADLPLPAPTFSTQKPVVANPMAFLTDGFSANIETLSWDLGITLGVPGDISVADSYGEVFVVGPRRVIGGFDPLATLVASYDWVDKWKSDNAGSMTTGLVGSVAGNRWQATWPLTQYTEIGRGAREGVRARAVQFLAQESAGDDEYSLVFT